MRLYLSLIAIYPLKSNFFIGSEIICLARNTMIIPISMLVGKLLERISKQGSQKWDIKILLSKIFGRHFEVFGTF